MPRVVFAIVAVGLLGACAKDGEDRRGSAGAAPVKTHTCLPPDVTVDPGWMTLDGSTVGFCLSEPYSKDGPYCFTADFSAKTIAPAPTPVGAPVGRGSKQTSFYGTDENATIERSAHGKGLTVCTADKATCHEVPIDAARVESMPMAASKDATLVAIETHPDGPHDTQKTPGRMETWDAVTGKKIASFVMHYGPDDFGSDHGLDGILSFFEHTVLAFSLPCALPCSYATMYDVHGKYLGLLASEVSSAVAEHFHDNLYLLHSSPSGPFVVQDAVTGKSVVPGTNTNWDAIVEPDRIVRVVGTPVGDEPMRPRVELWGPDLKLVSELAVPMCAPRR
jgi:hypothetical protein